MSPSLRDSAGPDDLLTAAGRGDQAAFGAFYDRTVSFIFPLLRGGFGDTRRAGEATERIYLRLWRAAPRFRAGDECACGLLLAAARQELAR
jgi:RNA polymerase sigma-70 factor (ECF subfamily)